MPSSGTRPRFAGEVRLHAADLDNNGAVDLLLAPVAPNAGDPSGVLIWLGNGGQKFTPLAQPAGPARVFDVADVNGDGRLDLLGLSAAGQAQQALNQGSKTYQWQILRPRARQATGDQRINSFGIGGEMELRSGLMLQKQPITCAATAFWIGGAGRRRRSKNPMAQWHGERRVCVEGGSGSADRAASQGFLSLSCLPGTASRLAS